MLYRKKPEIDTKKKFKITDDTAATASTCCSKGTGLHLVIDTLGA